MTVAIWKRILRWCAWLVGGALALLAAAYLAILLINLHDAPPTESAQRLAAAYRNRPAVRDGDNAYVYILGYSVAPSADPYAAGLRRVEWLRALPGQFQYSRSDDPVPDDESDRSVRPRAARNTADACRSASLECAITLAAVDPATNEWVRSEKWLLDRYLTLLGYEAWLETLVSLDMHASLPSYGLVFEGQMLLLVRAHDLATRNNASAVRELLAADTRFWRQVLASSDSLITKMIAVAALRRSFGVGNLILRRLPPGMQLDGMPQEWSVQLTDAERSMLRCLTGEWILSDGLLRQAEGSGSWIGGADGGPMNRAAAHLLMPFFQAQDLSNRRAEMFIRAAEAIDVRFDRLPHGLDRAREIFENANGEGDSVVRLYNPVGHLLHIIAAPAFATYSARVSDLEGLRRAAVLATELRSRHVEVARVSEQLAASSIRVPYTNTPFLWDAEKSSIVFIGRATGERGQYVLPY